MQFKKYRSQKLIEWKGETDKSTVVAGDFNFSLSVINTLKEQKMRKYIEDLNNTINQLDLTDIYRMCSVTWLCPTL